MRLDLVRSNTDDSVCRSVWVLSCVVLKLIRRLWTSTDGGRSEADGKLPLLGQEDDGADDEQPDGPAQGLEQHARVRADAGEDLLQADEEREQRVPLEVRQEVGRDL